MSTIVVDNKVRVLTGWKPDRPDHRDDVQALPPTLSHLPRSIDLRPTGHLPRIEDQGQLGSCTMNASTSAMEFLYRKANLSQPELSRLFAYYTVRVDIIKGNANDDSGAFLRDCMRALMKYGTCVETLWPYDVSKFAELPPKEVWKEALGHRIVKYFRVIGISGIRNCIAQGYPIVFGFSVPASIDSDETAATGIVKFPAQSEDIVGGHAVMAVGYDDDKELVTFQNSWGPTWGDKGFGYLPYKYFNTGMATDFWTIRTEDGVP